jgi:hypothetical protein
MSGFGSTEVVTVQTVRKPGSQAGATDELNTRVVRARISPSLADFVAAAEPTG